MGFELLFRTLGLLVLLFPLLLASELLGLLTPIRSLWLVQILLLHLSLIFRLFVCDGSQALGFLCSLLFALFTLILLNYRVSLISQPVKLSDAFLFFTLGCQFGLSFGLLGGQFALTLLFSFLLFLLFEDLLELLDGTVVLLGQFLELRSVFLFLFAKTGTLIFFFGSHELRHKLVSFGGCLIVDFLALFDNLGSFLVTSLIADGQWCITSIVSVEDVNSGVLDDIGEHFNVGHVPSH